MKCAIDLITRRLTANPYSHTLSWVMLRANQLRHLGIDVDVLHDPIDKQEDYTAWQKYDLIYIYHEMATTSTLHLKNVVNVYDVGYDKSAWMFERLIWPQHAHIEFVSLDFPMLDYGHKGAYKVSRPKTSEYWKKMDWKAVGDKCKTITTWVLDPGCGTSTHLVLGDSHAHSVYVPGAMVHRKDARTLAGALRKGFKNEIISAGYDFNMLKKLTVYFGSIDIRHHILREPDPKAYLAGLLEAYEAELLDTGISEIEVCIPLPIEDESRIIPGKGKYKDLPFYGTRLERIEVLKQFTTGIYEMAARHGWSVFQWPKDWYTLDGMEVMELLETPRSVHLGWCNYRWDLVNDCLNTKARKMPTSLLEF